MSKNRIEISVVGNNQFGKAADQLKAQFASLRSAALAAFGGYAIVNTLKESIRLANVQEEAEAKLAATLRATGGAAGFTAQQLQSYAAELQKVTTFGDETIIAGQALMATFTNIKGQVFNQATKAALDLSAAMNQDLKASVIQLGKALNDPVKGVSALSEVGVSFTEQQKDQIKAAVQANDLFKAQSIIIAELAKEFGGLAEAVAKTTGGQLQQFKNELGDIGEQVGAILIPSLRSLVATLKEVNAAASSGLGKANQVGLGNYLQKMFTMGDDGVMGASRVGEIAGNWMREQIQETLNGLEIQWFGAGPNSFANTERTREERRQMIKRLFGDRDLSPGLPAVPPATQPASGDDGAGDEIRKALKKGPAALNLKGILHGFFSDLGKDLLMSKLDRSLVEPFRRIGGVFGKFIDNIGGGTPERLGGDWSVNANLSPFVLSGFPSRGSPHDSSRNIANVVKEAASEQQKRDMEAQQQRERIINLLDKLQPYGAADLGANV